MRLFNRNNKKASSLQQQATSIKPLVPVITIYKHRVDANGCPEIRVTFVQSTAQPDYRYVNFLAWMMHVGMMSFFLQKTVENQRRLDWIISNNPRGGQE